MICIGFDIIIVSILIFTVITLFFWEPVRLDIIALSIPVFLVILNNWTKISVEEALSGFSNKATITVLAMFILSRGIQNSGLMHILGEKIAEIAGNKESKQVGIITLLSGGVAGILNNTPVVAIFIPVVKNLARKTKTSPSKLLIPLSFASMMGGMMTLIGTSTNLLASDLSERLINHRFSMFEFTPLGIMVLVVGSIYLIFLGRKLVPERINPNKDIFEEYEMQNYLTEVIIGEGCELIGSHLKESFNIQKFDMDIIQLIRNNTKYEPDEIEEIKEEDKLVVRADQSTLFKLIKNDNIKLLPETIVTEANLEEVSSNRTLLEVVIPHDSSVSGSTLGEMNFLEEFDTIVLAIRRGGKLSHQEIDNIELQPGDVLLLYAHEKTVDRLNRNSNFIYARKITDEETFSRKKIIAAGFIMVSVIGLAVFDVLPIVISAIAGVITMIAIGLLQPGEIYDAVNWQVIFLLAGLIPLGISMEQSGTASFISEQILRLSDVLPSIVMLGIFYLMTTFLTNIISNNASVVLMIPVAVNAAQKLEANPFSFILAVTFAASTAFLTPVGYQTNLMVYGPGGYKFKDYFKVGFLLQLLLTLVTVLGIYFIWGL
ncbi:MAG: SLC13 family permease [Halanaerobiaceae bacterium]